MGSSIILDHLYSGGGGGGGGGVGGGAAHCMNVIDATYNHMYALNLLVPCNNMVQQEISCGANFL